MKFTSMKFKRLRSKICAASKLPLLATAGFCLAFSYGTPARADSPPAARELLQLSLEDLMGVEVTSVARKSQTLADSPAAVFVISREDIRRSGATNIPDLLRMVPGVTVAQIDSNKWAVTARGFNGRFARKLLVLIDGRSVYTPLFSGVFWDAQDTMLEDIERIEVIRGPGATIWGANAVNGVINIITRDAQETTGGLVTAGAGSHERGFGSLRYGAEVGTWGAVRAYGKYFNRDEQKTETNQPADDSWDMGRGGFRMDAKSGLNSFNLQGDIYSGTERQTSFIPDQFAPPVYTRMLKSKVRVNGGNILSRWNRALDDDGELSLRMYYDRTLWDEPTVGKVVYNTVDLDVTHRFNWWNIHETVWGAGFRYVDEQLSPRNGFSMNPATRNERLYSMFLQDDITLLKDVLHFIVGTKVEHNIYTKFEVQPSGRLIWTPTTRLSIWGAVSRAVHTPSRGESDNFLPQAAMANPAGAGFPPLLIATQGPGNLKAEEMMAYEAGVRIQAHERLTIDLAGFYNNYKRLIVYGVGPVQPVAGPPPYLLQTLVLNNSSNGESWGGEMALDWQVSAPLRMILAYAYLNITDNTWVKAPEHQASLRSQFELMPGVELDLWWRYVGESMDMTRNSLAEYLNLDARLGWRPVKSLELSLVGRNLLHQRLQEQRPEYLQSLPSGTGREVYGKLTWSF